MTLPIATLTRTASTDEGTFGVFVLASDAAAEELRLASGELPWRDNAPRVSCIPPGIYECRWRFSPRFQRSTYELQGVPDRSAILIHPATWMGDRAQGYACDLEGCIGLGLELGHVLTKGGLNQRALRDSREAVKRLEERTAQQPFALEIREDFKRGI